MSSAEYQRRWRASKGARTGEPGRPASEPCGTPAAFRRHKRNGEEPCDACGQAEKERQADLYQRRKARGG